MRCKCGHEMAHHDRRGECVALGIGNQGFCSCAKFSYDKPRRRAKPFRRWSVSDTGVAHYDHADEHTWRSMGEVVELLNRARVVLPAKARGKKGGAK